MNYTQLVPPNLSTVGNIGWCLSFVEDAYNTPHLGATATDAWNSTVHPHKDRNLPDVQVPVWWSYYENGLNFGHVAIYVPGRGVLSSPYKANGTQQWFKDIDECGRVMGCQAFLGWSEDLATIQLIQGGSMATDSLNEGEITAIYQLAFDNGDIPTDLINAYKGKPLDGLLQQLQADPSYAKHYAKVNTPSNFIPYTGGTLFTEKKG